MSAITKGMQRMCKNVKILCKACPNNIKKTVQKSDLQVTYLKDKPVVSGICLSLVPQKSLENNLVKLLFERIILPVIGSIGLSLVPQETLVTIILRHEAFSTDYFVCPSVFFYF